MTPRRACAVDSTRHSEPTVWHSRALGIGLTAAQYKVIEDLAWLHGQTMDDVLRALLQIGCDFGIPAYRRDDA